MTQLRSRMIAYPSRTRQRGQALVDGLFVLISGLAALFFMFNTGQLTAGKTKLVDTADAVAYSAAVMHARALNFDAYTHRALIANEVLLAQMVSVAAWLKYANEHSQRVGPVNCTNYYSVPVGLGLLRYEVLCAFMAYQPAHTNAQAQWFQPALPHHQQRQPRRLELQRCAEFLRLVQRVPTATSAPRAAPRPSSRPARWRSTRAIRPSTRPTVAAQRHGWRVRGAARLLKALVGGKPISYMAASQATAGVYPAVPTKSILDMTKNGGGRQMSETWLNSQNGKRMRDAVGNQGLTDIQAAAADGRVKKVLAFK